MKTRCPRKITTLLIGVCFSGCASFEPALRNADLTRARQPTIQKSFNGLEVSIEEFASEQKSRQAFDADVAASGVLALLVRAENKSNANYKISSDSITVTLDGTVLPRLNGTEAANQAATSEYVGKALGWTVATGPFAILLWPVTIAGSTAHTHAVNRRIQQHFESVQFTDVLLRPNQVATGFVYFKLPENPNRADTLFVSVAPAEENGAFVPRIEFALQEVLSK